MGNKENVVKSDCMVFYGNLEFAFREFSHGLLVANENMAFGRIDGS